jgi:hypothetical protein
MEKDFISVDESALMWNGVPLARIRGVCMCVTALYDCNL